MYTKSLIQQKLELIQKRESFKESLNNVMNNYIIEDAFFGLSNNGMYEAVKGYFIEGKEYTNLDEAVREMKYDQVIHVLENKTFVVGDLVSQLSNCPKEAHIYDVEFLCKVR